MRKRLLILVCILTISTFLRFYSLGEVPPSPDWDEVALGYNAYSIMLTGRDEYGKFLPVVLRSFDDYKPALYTYFVIPSIKIFGLNVFAVRLPSVIFGIIAVLGTYLLVREIFREGSFFSIGEITAFLLAISPWHIQFSRIAFEANVGLSFNIFTALFFLKGLNNPILLPLSFVVGALNLHVYQGEKVFTPLLLFALVFLYRKDVLRVPKRWIVCSLAVAVVVVFPIIHFITINQDALLRARGVSVFSDETRFLAENVEKVLVDTKNRDHLGLLLDNRRVEYTKAIITGYLSHFDLNWLFVSGDLARHHAPNMGLLYLVELPFLLVGMRSLIIGKFNKRGKLVVFLWFFITPIAASITEDVPHAIRTLNFLPTFQIFTALGVLSMLSKATKIKSAFLKFSIVIFIFPFFILSIAYYLNQYFMQQNYFNSKDWQYGYKEVVSELKKIEHRYKKIIVSNQPHMDQSYMFFLFYLKYPPVLYQEQAKNASGGFAETHAFGKYEFRQISWESENASSTLFVGRPDDIPDSAEILKKIYFLDGSETMRVAQK